MFNLKQNIHVKNIGHIAILVSLLNDSYTDQLLKNQYKPFPNEKHFHSVLRWKQSEY